MLPIFWTICPTQQKFVSWFKSSIWCQFLCMTESTENCKQHTTFGGVLMSHICSQSICRHAHLNSQPHIMGRAMLVTSRPIQGQLIRYPIPLKGKSFVNCLTPKQAVTTGIVSLNINAPSLGANRSTHQLYTQSQKTCKIPSESNLSSYLSGWEEELIGDPDREFILHGLIHGFDIIDKDSVPSTIHCDNHTSAKPGSPLYKKACEQVQKEIEMGHYEVLSDPPTIISPIGVIPKPDGCVRLIHDCSRLTGLALNDYCTSEWKQKFSTVDEAAKLVTKGCFMAKVELKQAYRSVGLSHHSKTVTRLRWHLVTEWFTFVTLVSLSEVN